MVVDAPDPVPGMGPITPEPDSLDNGDRTRRTTRRKTTRSTTPPTDGPTPPPTLDVPTIGRATDLQKSLEKFYVTVGIGLAPFDMICAQEIVSNASQCARAWDELAKQNDSVRRVLEGLVKTGAWGGVIAANLPIIVGVALHHGGPQIRDLIGRAANMQQRAESADGQSPAA